MSRTTLAENDPLSGDADLSQNGVLVQEADPDEGELVAVELMEEDSPVATGPVCSNCGSPSPGGMVEICRSCGYYARLGTLIELAPCDRADYAEQLAAQTPPAHWEIWMRLVPAWAWFLLGCVLATIAESVAVRLLTADGSQLRTVWSFSQLVAGVSAAALIHVVAYTLGVVDNDQLKPLDIFIKPLACWLPTLKMLPQRLPLVAIETIGLTAALMSVLVIGGLNYEKLLDWGIREQPKQNLMAAVMDKARQIEGKDQSLEEAVTDFAGKGELEETPPPPPKPRKFAECLIVGYLVDPERPDDFSSLVLASVVKNQLTIVGRVEADLPAEAREQLNHRLRAVGRARPFVPSTLAAHWVEPVLTCRVSYVRQTSRGTLNDAQFVKLLAEIDWPSK